MKNTDIVSYLADSNFVLDELGRIVIDDPTILSEINGAYSSGDAFSSALANGACANISC